MSFAATFDLRPLEGRLLGDNIGPGGCVPDGGEVLGKSWTRQCP